MRPGEIILLWNVWALLPAAVFVAVLVGCASPAITPTSTPTPTHLPTSTIPGAGSGPLPSPTPTHTRVPTPAAASTPTPTPTPTDVPGMDSSTVSMDGIFPAPPDRDLYELARSLAIKTHEPIPTIVNAQPPSYTEGREDTFWITSLDDLQTYTSQAILRLVSPHAYWYVEDDAKVSQDDLEKAAGIFENEIYPRVTSAFGAEWTPGIDNDPHITILHARLEGGVAGYFSSADEYPSIVYRHSNEREMVYLNTRAMRVGSQEYLAVLSHELQHAVHWNGDSTEETWVNEGLAEVATVVAGYSVASGRSFLHYPTISLTHWPLSAMGRGSYYGAAFLFFSYLASHYGTYEDLKMLAKEPLDGIPGITSYLSGLGYDETFRDVFKDWVVANFLDAPGNGPYSYPSDDVQVRVTARIDWSEAMDSSIPQYSAEYILVDIDDLGEGDIKLRFQGQTENALLPISLEALGGEGEEAGCWWSNRGDSISSTLTRSLDLSVVDTATLGFRIWFDIEEDWDYGYLEVSTDQGITWDIIPAPGTSPTNPVGNSFGPGYTGHSDGWERKEVDLRGYAGGQALLRFHYVTDEAIGGMGFCIGGISIPEIGFFDSGPGDEGWQAEGFAWTDNRVPQDYIVQVIEVAQDPKDDDLAQDRVREMVLDEDNRGEMIIGSLQDLEQVVVVVAALAPATGQEAGYTLEVRPASED